MTEIRSRQIAILGGGIMGSGVAGIFARGGWQVHVATPSAGTRATLPARMKAALDAMPPSDTAPGSLVVHARLETVPWHEIDLVLECVTEDLALKRSLFAEVERFARPEIPIATNTSGLSIGGIAADLDTRSRVAGLHFFMPAHLVPLVEIVSAPFTDPRVADALWLLMRDLGKVPIRVARDIPGFVGNRLQHAVLREALWLVEDGVASPEDIDAAVRYGFGFRFLACGPLLQKEMSGWDVHLRAAATVYPSLCTEPLPPPSFARMLEEGRIGMKTLKGLWEWTPESAAAERSRIERIMQASVALLGESPAAQSAD